jgi:hypothetical protein
MKTILQWASLGASAFALVLVSATARAQTLPTVQGTSVADAAVPVLIAPAPVTSGFFVLNQDFSVLQHSLTDNSQNQSCPRAGIFSQTNPAARTLVVDQYNAYFSGPDAPGYNTAVDAVTPEVSCTPVQPLDYTGGVATQSVASNDPQHALYYLVDALGGADVDELIVLPNLNNTTVYSSGKFTSALEAALDTGGVYTSIVSDTRSSYGLTAITELKTSTSPGNLFVYDPQTSNVYRILGPGGTKLPAVTSFIIPPQTDGGGSLLVLVNQDGLTTSNFTAPPQDTAPLTIIDLGQLQAVLATSPAKNTVTLPFVTQIQATTPFYAMLGAAYNPLDHRVYAVVGGGTSASSIVENIISYDTLNPSAPSETVVADVSNVPFSLGSYPQIALNAASGTMQILTSSPSMLYTVGITGTGNAAISVPGSTFPDSNFQPTYVVANPLLGETYIASASGQVDVLTRPATAKAGLALTLSGSDLGYTSQQYQVKPLALYPVYDSSLSSAALTITATPDGGAPVTVATAHVSDVGYPGGSFFTYTFPAAGRYTLVATAAASANYPAVTSPPLYVYVGNTGVYPTSVALSLPASVAATNGTATLNATVTLTGTTYAPTGQVYVTDATGTQVGLLQLPKGVISNPLTVPITVNQGNQMLTAVYGGDAQNQGAKSTPQAITVGTVTKVTPVLMVTVPATAVAGAAVTGGVTLTSTSTTTPTGSVTIYAALSGGAASPIATVTAAQAFGSGGMSFTFTAPAAGSYTVYAGYGGDSTYNNAVSANVGLVVGMTTTSLTVSGPANVVPGASFITTVTLKTMGSSTAAITGNVTLKASSTTSFDTYSLGTIPAASAMMSGGVQVTGSLPVEGVYSVTATYAGDANYASSQSTIVVNVSLPTTSLGLSAATNQTAGVAFPLNVSLKQQAGFTGMPTGNVVISTTAGSSTTTLATITAAQALTSGGYPAQVTLPSGGSYLVTAIYAGDSNFAGTTASLLITAASTATLTLRSVPTSSLTVNTNFQLCVDLSSTTTTATPTGSFALSATDPTGNPAAYPSVPAASSLAKTACTSPFQVAKAGNWTFTAAYPGDSNYPPLLATLLLSFQPQTSSLKLTGAATATALSPYQVVTTLTTLAPSPSGNLNIVATLNGSSTPASTIDVDATAALSGATSFITFPAAGTYTVTATFPSDPNLTGSSATPLTVVVAPAPPSNFTLTLDNSFVDTQGGSLSLNGTHTTTVTLTAIGTGPGPVNLTSTGSYPGVIVFRDATTNKLITSATPTTTGTKVILEYDSATPTAALRELDIRGHAAPISVAGGLFGLALFGWRRRRNRNLRGLYLLGAVTVIVTAASVLAGCLENAIYSQANITATPVTASAAAPPQSVVIVIESQGQ